MLNQPFRKHARTGRPLVIFKSAMTLDGKVATRTGDSQWISGEASRARAHRWRAESDAVAVGIGTALADDPLLTARVEGVARQPRRVVFDSEARLPLDSQLVSGVAEVPLIVVCSRAAARTSVQALESAGVDVIVATGENEAARVRARARRARRSRDPVAAARGRPAPGRRVPRGRGDRRGAHVRRADHARRAPGEDRGRGHRRRRDRGRPARARHRDRADRGRRADRRPASRSGEVFTGLVAGKGHRRVRSARRARGRWRRRWPRSSSRATRSPSTASA